MPRKITQLAAVSAGDVTGFLYALCDDGTVWMLSGGWEKMESIPQDGYDKSPAYAIPTPLAEPPVPAKPAWLERLQGLWAVTNDGDKTTEIRGVTELREAAADPTVTVVEARIKTDAFGIYRSNKDYPPAHNYFTVDGQRFEYLTDEIPF